LVAASIHYLRADLIIIVMIITLHRT